jgi:S1-C subfamily serine protease
MAPVSEAATPHIENEPPVNRREIVKRILPQNVRVFIYDGKIAKRTASGVVVGSEPTARGSYSYVVTNAHVLDGPKLAEPRLTVVVDVNGEPMEHLAEPVAIGKAPEMDLALLRVRGVQLEAAQLANTHELELGDDVVVVAAPFGRALSLSGGMISQLEVDPKSRLPVMLKTDAPIGYGASGGGVYSLSTGKLLAIVEGYRTAKFGFAVEKQDFSFDLPMPGETFAAPSAKVRAFLQANGFERFVGTGRETANARAAL